MIGRVFRADVLKLRRSMAMVLVWLGPVGVIALTAANFGLRYDYLVKLHQDDLWQGLLDNISGLASFALLLGAALLTSMLAGYEHRTNAWKQLLALPVTRSSVFISKALLCAALLLISSALLAAGTYLLGGVLGFGWNAPIADIIGISFYPALAGLGIMGIQLWLAVVVKNQAIALTAGIAGTIIGMFSFRLPDWVMWKWVVLQMGASPLDGFMLEGLICGVVVVLLGTVHFVGRDVN